MDKIKKAKAQLEHYLEGKVKDFHILDAHTAQMLMSINTYTIWRAWRDLQDVCEGDIK